MILKPKRLLLEGSDVLLVLLPRSFSDLQRRVVLFRETEMASSSSHGDDLLLI